MPTKVPPLSESHPDIAARWMGNVVVSDRRDPDGFSIKARLRCWWWCGKPEHEWFTAPPGEHLYQFDCPHCRADSWAESRRLRALSVADVPALVAAWHDERPFDGLLVEDLCTGVAGQNFGLTYKLRCSNGHKIDTVVWAFLTNGCPWCRGNKTRRIPSKPLADADPEMAAMWHPTRNGEMTAASTPADYIRPVWWMSVQCCGYEWEESIRTRALGRRPQAGRGHYLCPQCETVWGSLAWLDPELASEWHKENDITPWHVRPYSSGVVVKWRCVADPAHEWNASVIDRSAGRLCPNCSTAGTSQIERAFLTAARLVDADARAARIGRWKVDVLVPTLRLVIEYDGEYWHRSKHETDRRKTAELIAAGYRVARVRENSLAHLALESPNLRQVSFRPDFGRIDAVVRDLAEWASLH